jgi:hypothetical protein
MKRALFDPKMSATERLQVMAAELRAMARDFADLDDRRS